ncbi:DUF2793 domain-containing protein [Phaeovulum sp.]|uniref:DUF2793 domain-containing protein n=1 Tax=Phaeovulum sp. TaxID=2934796 RepID=UPI0039E712A4
MSDTNRLALPLLQPAQAQKHVTVNEALTRLDGLVNMVMASNSLSVPPTVVLDGATYGIPAGAVNVWAGQAGKVAIGSNGGWVFVSPRAGWRTFIADEGCQAIHDGTGWVSGALSLSPFGAGLSARVVEIDHVILAGATSQSAAVIPSHSMVIGVSARVISAIGGTLTSWELGNIGFTNRFGAGLGLAQGSWVRGLLSQPMTYWAPETLLLSAVGGDFASGAVRLAVHYLEISLPSE